MFVLIPDQHLGMVMLMNAGLQLPLPGADGVLDRIPSETVSLLLGQQPASAMSLNRFYLIFDAVVFLIVAVQSGRFCGPSAGLPTSDRTG